MHISLHITPGPSISAEVIKAFAEKAKRQGKTPEQLVADLICKAAGTVHLVIKPTAAEKRRHKAVKAGE